MHVATAPPPDWDDLAVRVPGGHVMQSATWGEYRRSQGFEPRYVRFDDGRVALVTCKRSALLPGAEAAVRRGPAHAGDGVLVHAARVAALVAWARRAGVRDLFIDPERDADPAWEAALRSAGLSPTEEREPSVHVMRLDLGPLATTESVWSGLSRSTRQRIRAAEASGTRVREDGAGSRLEEFAGLLRDRATALGIPLQAGTGYLRGWRRLMEAGLARLLVADHDGELVGGLFLYRHAGIHATAYSADRAERRTELPGTMHLVRWTAISGAIEDGVSAIELGGVDLPGRRRPPQPGDPTRGLYEHKRSFGAHWVDRSRAHHIVLRPWADALARVRRQAIDAARRVGR